MVKHSEIYYLLLCCAVFLQVSSFFCGKLTLTRKTQCPLSTHHKLTTKEIVFDTTIREDVRAAYLELFEAKERAEKDKERAEKEKEKERADKEKERADKERADKEKAVLAKELSETITIVKEITRQNTLMAPRAVIEFVETFVFDKYNIPKDKDRALRWKHFFREADIGKAMFSCLCERNTLWSKNISVVAQRVSDIYRSTSDYHHQTSLEIYETQSLNITENALVKQTYNFVACVAEHCQLKLSLN